MAKIKLKGGISLTDNQEVKVPKFNFSNYDGSGRTVYHNNAEYIDFVTDNGSLYVCLVDSVQPTGSIGSNSAFLKLVDRGPEGPKGKPGEDGVSAVEPRIGANFINDQLKVTVNDRTVAVSPSLTGPTWKPVRDGNILTWELTDDRISPSDINLMDLRPIDKCPLLLRTNSDNTKRDDEVSGPANFIQWKYEGDEHWTNLISISELMNLALCGICFWYDDNDGEWHFGNKEVLKATYHSDKNGRKIISRVELGDVLFDAGSIPINDYGVDIALINQRLDALENTAPDLDGYATEDWVNAQGFLKDVPEVDAYTKAQSDERFQPKGDYVEGVSVNGGRVKRPVNGIVDLEIEEGEQIDAYTKDEADERFQPKGTYVKSVNNQTPDANGNVTITLGDFDLTAYVKKSDLATINGTVLYNGGNFDLGGGTVIGLQDVEVSVSNGKLRYRKKENGTWGSYTNIMDVPASTGDGDTVNGFVNVSLSGNVLTFTRQDGTTKSITLPSSGDGQGCEYCWTEEQILGLINGALSNYYTKSQVYTKGEIDAMIGGSTNSYRTFMIFKRSASASSETLPSTTITWNVSQGELDIPSGSNGWTEHPENATSQKPYLWMASASFQSINGERVGDWDGPFCLTGEKGQPGANGYDGTDGADGNGIEFIFTLIRDINDKSSVSTPEAPVGQGEDDIPEGWEDHPQGMGYYVPSEITTTLSNLGNEEILFGIELASMRRFVNGEWQPYCEPFIWSMWGEDGVDGDGVEYIYFIAAQDRVTVNQSTGKVTLDPTAYITIPITQEQVDELGDSYQVPEWTGPNDNNWTDNPSDVDANQPYEFVMMRKYHDGTGWGPFYTPKLWAHFGGITITPTQVVYGSTNYRPYTCYAFYRTNTEIGNYSVIYDFSAFGSTVTPNPTYSDLTDDQKNLFYENPQNYCKTLNENNQEVPIIWQDTVPDGDTQLWLITAHIGDENQVTDTGWTSPMKWGDRAGFNVEYSKDSNAAAVYANPSLWNSHNLTFNDFSGTDEEREAAWETAVRSSYGVWSDNVTDPVYMATTVRQSNGIWTDWVIAKIKGENGKDGINGTDGSDGKSIEFVYYRTKGAEPSIKEVNDVERGTYDPEDTAQRTETDKDLDRDDFFPAVAIATKTDGDYWHDHPSGVTEQLPYEWVATRTSAIQNGRRYWTSKFSVALWSKFGADGRDGDGIEYVFWGLSDADVQALNSTWPTQRAANAKNNGSNVQPERKDIPYNRSITDNEYLPAILINNTPLQAVDNNPGIEDNRYVYASMRKYNGASKEWGEFGEIKLWNEQSADNHNCVLHIENDSESVLVNNLNIIDDSFETFAVNIDDLWLRDNTTLLNIDQIAVNGVAFVNFSGQTITPVAGASTTIELDATHSLQITYSGAYVSPDRYNTKQIVLRLTFTEGSEIVAPIAIPISASSNGLVGTDLLTLFPVNVNELIKIGTVVTQDYHTSTRGSYDYDQSTVGITPSGLYQEPIKTVEKLNYWVAFDQDKATAFTSGTSYFGPFSVPNAEREGAPGVNGTLEYDYYFKNNGTLQNSVDDETLIHVRMYHTGNEMRDTDQWNGYAEVYFGDYSVDPNNGFLPIDNIIVGVGYPNSSNTPVVTDREEYKIIYNGSTGPQGPQGPQGPEGPEGPQGPKGEDGESVVTYEYLNGTIMRVSAWNDGTTESTKYWAGETRVLGEGSSEHDGGNEGIKYLDVVSVTSGDKTSWYKCKSNHTKNSTNPANDTVHWSEFSMMGDAAFVNMLVENAAYIENLTVKNLNTAGEGSSALERIVASGNTMYMTDNTGAQRFKLTGDDINWTTPLATYPQQNTSYYSSYSNETISDSFERSLFGTIAVSAPDSTLTVPDLQITADVNGCTSGQPQDWTSIGITIDVYLYKNGTQYATVGSATLEYSPEDDIDTTNASISSKSFSVPIGNYTIMLVASINGQRGAQCSYVSIDLTFGSTANNVTVSSTDANENNVQIGSNGMAIQLGNGFAVIFGIDSNSSPLIQLQGTNSQGNTVGIRITSAGLEKNTGSGWGSL